MENAMERPDMERTSVYFNNILRADVVAVSVDELPAETVEGFNEQVRLAFADEAEDAIRRVRYLVPYILQSIDWDEYGMPLEAWQLHCYYRRERFLAKTHLSYDKFLDHQPLQRAIAALGLDPEPTFEFILFLKYYYGMRSDLRYSAVEQLELALQALSQLPADGAASIDINVGGKHYKIQNTRFVKRALMSIDCEGLSDGAFVNDFSEGANRDKIRAIDYYIIKTLMDYLPTRRTSSRTGAFTQEERNFGLSVLSFIGRLPDVDREGECGKENNATFDKLMRDFKECRIPFAMELFL